MFAISPRLRLKLSHSDRTAATTRPDGCYQAVCRSVCTPNGDLVDLTGQLSNPRGPLDSLANKAQRAAQAAAASPPPGSTARRAVQRRLRPHEVAELVEAYKAGATERGLGAKFGIHRTTVAAHLERAGVQTRRGRGLEPAEVTEAVCLDGDGWSAARLGKRYGVSHHTITAALRKAGVAIRPRGRLAQSVSHPARPMAGGSNSR